MTAPQWTSTIEGVFQAAASSTPGDCGGTAVLATTTVLGGDAFVNACDLSALIPHNNPQIILSFFHNKIGYSIWIYNASTGPAWAAAIANSFTFSTPTFVAPQPPAPPVTQAIFSASHSLTINSPVGHVTYHPGDTIAISWTTQPGTVTAKNDDLGVSIESVGGSGGIGSKQIANSIGADGTVSNTGSLNWVIPTSTPSGVYRIYINDTSAWEEGASFTISAD
jgi:hypothetical protein